MILRPFFYYNLFKKSSILMIEPADDVKALSLLKSIDESSILTIEPAADFKAVSLSESIQEIIDSDG